MTEQQREAFEQWFETCLDRDKELCLGDKELCRHAWQAALSHAEGEAVAYQYRRKNQFTGDWSGWVPCDPDRARYLMAGDDPDADLYEVRELVPRGPEPQVAVPERRTWSEDDGISNYHYTEGWNDCLDVMLAAPAGDIPQVTAYDHAIPVRTTSSDDEQPVSDPDGLPSGLTFNALRAANAERIGSSKYRRCEEAWTPAHWMQATVGELGELANLLKKVDRGDFDLPDVLPDVRRELADVQTYLDILALKLGVDLGAATIDKFNEVSERIGSHVRLAPTGHDHATELCAAAEMMAGWFESAAKAAGWTRKNSHTAWASYTVSRAAIRRYKSGEPVPATAPDERKLLERLYGTLERATPPADESPEEAVADAVALLSDFLERTDKQGGKS